MCVADCVLSVAVAASVVIEHRWFYCSVISYIMLSVEALKYVIRLPLALLYPTLSTPQIDIISGFNV